MQVEPPRSAHQSALRTHVQTSARRNVDRKDGVRLFVRIGSRSMRLHPKVAEKRRA